MMTKPQTRQTYLVLAALIALVALLAFAAQAHAKKYLYVFHFDELTYNGIIYPADVFSFTSPALIGPTGIPGSPFINSLNLASPLDLNGCSFSTIRCDYADLDSESNLIGIGFTTGLPIPPFTVGQVESFEARINFPPGAYGPGFYTSDSFGRGIASSPSDLYFPLTTGSLNISEVTEGYKFTTINVPGGSDTTAWGINDAGQIVGDCSTDKRGFLLSGGGYTFIEVPSALDTHPTDISEAGWIVGSYYDSSSKKHGFLWPMVLPPFDAPGASNTSSWGINKIGKIVGEYDDSTGTHGFLWEGGNYTPLDFSDSASFTKAFGINDAIQIVGSYGSTGTHGFLWEDGFYTSLDFPGASYTEARSINNAGQIVGFYIRGTEVNGFLWSGGNYTTIKVPGTNYTWAFGINNAGQIVGAYLDSTGRHGFLATPVHPIIPSIMLLLE